MSTEIRIRPGEVAPTLRQHHGKMLKAMNLATHAAAMKLKAHLIARVDEMGITDRGTYKNGFRVNRLRNGATVTNDAPHAGIVELGARPHPVSREGIEAIAAWVRRKLRHKVQPRRTSGRFKTTKFNKDEALSVAYAIAENIKKFGMKPRYVMRDAQVKAKEFYQQELNRILRAGIA